MDHQVLVCKRTSRLSNQYSCLKLYVFRRVMDEIDSWMLECRRLTSQLDAEKELEKVENRIQRRLARTKFIQFAHQEFKQNLNEV